MVSLSPPDTMGLEIYSRLVLDRDFSRTISQIVQLDESRQHQMKEVERKIQEAALPVWNATNGDWNKMRMNTLAIYISR